MINFDSEFIVKAWTENDITGNDDSTLIIESDGEVIGDIKAYIIVIKGKVTGDVHARYINIADTAIINGNVYAAKSFVNGLIEGKLKSYDVYLHENSIINGDVSFHQFNMEVGAKVNGFLIRVCLDDFSYLEKKIHKAIAKKELNEKDMLKIANTMGKTTEKKPIGLLKILLFLIIVIISILIISFER